MHDSISLLMDNIGVKLTFRLFFSSFHILNSRGTIQQMQIVNYNIPTKLNYIIVSISNFPVMEKYSEVDLCNPIADHFTGTTIQKSITSKIKGCYHCGVY